MDEAEKLNAFRNKYLQLCLETGMDFLPLMLPTPLTDEQLEAFKKDSPNVDEGFYKGYIELVAETGVILTPNVILNELTPEAREAYTRELKAVATEEFET